MLPPVSVPIPVEEEARGDAVAGARARPARPRRGVPRVARDRERLVEVRHADRELHRRDLAGDHRAGGLEARHHRAVLAGTPIGIEHEAVGGGRAVRHREDVLHADGDAVQRAPVDAGSELGVGGGGGEERGVVEAREVTAELGVERVGARADTRS